MKRLDFSYKTTIITGLFLLMFTYAMSGGTSVKSQGISEWYGNNNFEFSDNNGMLNVNITKNPWESFTLMLDNMMMVNNPVVELEMSSSRDITIRVDISDGIFISSKSLVIEKDIEGSGVFHELNFDFSEVLFDIDLSENAFLIFYVNPGKKFDGNIKIRNHKFHESVVENTDKTNLNLNLFPSPATSFTNLSIPDGYFSEISVYDITGKEVLKINKTFYSGENYRLDISNIPNGYYVVTLSGDSNKLSSRLIKN